MNLTIVEFKEIQLVIDIFHFANMNLTIVEFKVASATLLVL